MAEQESGSGQQPQKMLKFAIHHFRHSDADEEAFMKWYQEEQIPRMRELIKKHNIDKFALHLTPSFLRPKFQEDLDRLKGVPGWKMADFDATTSYWVTDADKLRAMISDPDWEGKVVKFEKGWTDTSKAYVQAGWETVYPGHGEGDH